MKDELILKVSNALNESKFWLRLDRVKLHGEKELGKILDMDFKFEEFAPDLEEFIADKIMEELQRIAVEKLLGH